MMADYTSVLENGAAVDAELIKVRDSNLNPAHKITRGATVVVAASNSSKESRDQADYVCDGVADDVEIQAALDSLPSSGGKIQLLDGGYKLVSILSRNINNVTIAGGGNNTSLTNDNSTTIIDLGSTSNWTITDMYLDYGGITLQSAKRWLIQNIWRGNKAKSGATHIDMWSDKHIGAASDGNLSSELSKHPLIQVFSDFEEDDWETLGLGTQKYDTDIKYCGSRSLKAVTGVGSSQQITTRVGMSIPDFTNCAFSMMIYTPDYTKIQSIELDIKTIEDNWNNYGKFDAKNIQRVNNKWWKLIFPYMDIGAGTPDYTIPKLVRIRVIPYAGESATVYLDDFRYFKRVLTPRGAVTFTFDDGLQSVTNIVKPAMDKYNYAGVSGIIISDSLDNAIARCRNLQRDGWDIVNHSYDHESTRVTTEPKWQYILSQKYLREYGFPRGSRFALLAGGLHSAEIEYSTDEYILLSRGTMGGHSCLPDPGNLVSALIARVTTPVDTIKGWIDEAITNGTWINLMFHDIVTSDATDLNYLATDLVEIIEYCHSSGIEVLTYSQVVDRIRSSAQNLTLSGSGTIAGGSTSVNIRHGFHKEPTSIQITPTSSLGTAASIWVSSKDTGTGNLFTVSTNIDPGQDVTFDWQATL